MWESLCLCAKRSRNKKFTVIALKSNRDLAFLNELFESGDFKPLLDVAYNFTEYNVRQAFLRLSEATNTGKIVIYK
ncbi:zinc-binding dehydrogenase [Colwellia sp. RSH04]|uniref:zinc-binding dehydrogenase n=1 Tax=Colwellia sp. RSH04 TaxID=2305464 RepID=UPI000E593747|nr:hypothetical protein D1094_17325 [Colwellia sp. RSH04]